MCVSGFSCTPVASISICDQRGAFWLQMCPSVYTQWTIHLSNNYQITTQIKYNVADNMQI